MNRILYLIFFVLIPFLGLTQAPTPANVIYGKVRSNDSAIGGATVTLRTLEDSALVKGTATSYDGVYELADLDTGRYLLDVSYLGFLPYIRQVSITQAGQRIMENVNLVVDSLNYLEAVRVVARKPFMTRSVDKTTINIDGSVYSKGENALRLFNVIPGVRVDPLAGIQFRGAQGVTVYVDNRRIQLSGQQLLDYLRGIPSEAIKSYELQAVAGVSYDAQNSGTIINITLKDNYKYGLSGSIGSSYKNTRYNEFDENVALNYRVGNLTLQGNYAWYGGKQFQDNEEIQRYKESGLYNIQTNQWTSDVRFQSGKFGFDYRLGDNHIIGGNYDFSVANFESRNTSLSSFKSDVIGNEADSTTNTLNTGTNTWRNEMAAIFYRGKLDSAGSKLDLGYSYIGYNNSVSNNLNNMYMDADNNALHPPDSLFIDNPLKVDIHAANIDLEKIFPKKKLTFNTGAKYTYSRTNNAIDYQEGSPESPPVYDLKSNKFIYNEAIAALYASLSKAWSRWSVKVGLRAEHYKYSGSSTTTGEKIGRSRLNLFPSVFLQHKVNDENALTLSSGRRITRPDYRQLNPFVDVSNPYYIERGNPFLLPYFTNSIELEYLLKSKYSFTVGYQHTANSINTVYQNDGPIIISTDENINDNRNVFASISVPVNVTNWWEISSSFTIRHTTIRVNQIPPETTSRFSQDFWMSNRIRFLKGYFLEISGFYSRNNFIGIYDLRPQGRIDMNIKKTFLKDKLTAMLNIGDPFNLYRIGWNVNENDFTRQVKRRLPTRYIGIGLTYNFSSGKKQTNRENIEAAGNDARGRL